MVGYSHLLKNFPQYVVIHTVKGFGIVNKAEIGVFLELSCFFDDPSDMTVDLWFLCIFLNSGSFQLEYLEVHGSRTVGAWLGEF